MKNWIKPYGYLSSGDIAQISGLRGMQVQDFLHDFGVEIDGRMVIKENQYRALEEQGTLLNYKSRPTWNDKIRKADRRKKNDV